MILYMNGAVWCKNNGAVSVDIKAEMTKAEFKKVIDNEGHVEVSICETK